MTPIHYVLFAILAGARAVCADAPFAHAAPAPSNASLTLCRDVVAQARALPNLHTKDTQGHAAFYAPGLLSRLADKTGGLVTTTPPISERVDGSTKVSSPEAQRWLDALGVEDDFQHIDHFPDSDCFAVSSLGGGSLSGYGTRYFRLDGEKASPAKGPVSWSDDNGGGIGVTTRIFGTVKGTAVAFQEDYAYGPALTSTLAVEAWRQGGFAPPCTVAFTYAPRFSADVNFDRAKPCKGRRCALLRSTALALAQAVERNPGQAQRDFSPYKLPQPERQRFLRWKKEGRSAFPVSPYHCCDPATLRDDQPLLLPVEVKGRLYLAAIGHVTVGWRAYSDWRVTFTKGGKNKRPDASFVIGMARGQVIKASIK